MCGEEQARYQAEKGNTMNEETGTTGRTAVNRAIDEVRKVYTDFAAYRLKVSLEFVQVRDATDETVATYDVAQKKFIV